jgi:hypothetical protein
MYKWLFNVLFGLLTIWTGLWRGIEAQAYKPNALWFCMVTGLIAVAAGYLYRLDKRVPAAIAGGSAGTVVLLFYLHSFITNPEGDATFRVALIIVGAIGQLVVVTLPAAHPAKPEATEQEEVPSEQPQQQVA